MTSAPDFTIGITRFGTHRRPCPACGRRKRDTALSITMRPDGSFVWCCHRCGLRGPYRDVMSRYNLGVLSHAI